jgi:hypothetical protein
MQQAQMCKHELLTHTPISSGLTGCTCRTSACHRAVQQSTYDFQLLSGDTPSQRTASAADGSSVIDTYYDSQ